MGDSAQLGRGVLEEHISPALVRGGLLAHHMQRGTVQLGKPALPRATQQLHLSPHRRCLTAPQRMSPASRPFTRLLLYPSPPWCPQVARMPKASGCRPRVVVFTQGCDPTIVAVGGKVYKYPVKQLAKEELVDTNGAGACLWGGCGLRGVVRSQWSTRCQARRSFESKGLQ